MQTNTGNTNQTTNITNIFPDGEFTSKIMIQATGKSQPAVHLILKKGIQSGLIKEVRRERTAPKGRPTVIYTKV